MIQTLFTLFAISQGSLVIGLTAFVLIYYLPTTVKKGRERLRWYIISAALSYILLTLATVKTAAFEFYNWGDIWYWIVTTAYIVGDISIAYVFREMIIMKKRKDKIDNHKNN